MATDKKQVEIPGRLHSVATEGVVAGANEILDDNKGKNQQEINASVDDSLQENKTGIANEITRATNAENAIKGGSSKSIQNLDSRLSTVEAHDTISMDGGSVVVGTAEDFTNRTTAGDAKIPTVGAILNGADEEPIANSENLVKSGGVHNELALGAVYDVSAKNPTAGPNNDGKWESLSALLSDANLNTLIPTTVRKGGMGIKFVQSSNNKYVSYRLTKDEWSIDTDDWAIADEGVYVNNPEFVYVKADSEGKILWAIKTNGSIYYGAGVPQQIIDYIEEKIVELSLDEYEDIVNFLNGLEKGDKTLQTLLDEKVDKEEGKSLIDAEYANGVRYIENPEFAEVKVDNEDRILEAIMKDGTKLLPAGVKVVGTVEYDGATIKTIDNPEFAGVWLDGEDKILFGVEQDGNFLFGCGVPRQVKEYIEQKIEELSLDEYESIVAFIGDYLNNTTLEELLSKKVDGEYMDNPEFIEAKTDAEDKVLEGTKKDGTKLFGGDVKVIGNMEVSGVSYKIIESPEYIAAWLDAKDKVIFGFKNDGKTYVGDADFLNNIKNNQGAIDEIRTYLSNFDSLDIDALTSIITIENPEFVEVKLDADNKVIEGTRTDGTKVIGSNLEIGENLKVKGNVEIGGNVSYKKGIPQEIIDYIDANTGSGVSSIEYDDATGDMYATFNDDDGVTDVYMDENGDIYVDIEE